MRQDVTSYHFADAIMPVDFIVCGVYLRPFSLGSFLLLEQTGNPMMGEAAVDVSMSDGLYHFFSALLICSTTYEENLKILSDDVLHKKIFDAFTDNLLKNIEIDPQWNIYHKINLFRDYINHHMEIPFYSEENTQKGLASGTDWKQNIFLTFKKLGYSETEILNMSFKRLFNEWCSWAESEGAIKVLNKWEVKQMRGY